MLKKISFMPCNFTGKEEVIIVPLYKNTALRGPVRKLDVICQSAISKCIKNSSFIPDSGETLLMSLNVTGAPRQLLLLGFGERSGFKSEKIMRAAGNASKLLKKRRLNACYFILGETPMRTSPTDFLLTFIKGFSLALYTYSKKSQAEREKKIEELIIMSSREKRKLARAAARAQLLVEHTEQVRDMVNTPGNELTPKEMARQAKSLCKQHNIHCRILGPSEIKKQKMGAIIGVSQGSAVEPRLIVMHHNRNKQHLPVICLIGKGVTFDSGGISIKSWEHMDEMKGDMAGGAVVISAVSAAARMKIPLQVIGIVPCVENLPSHKALKPGDIISTYSGKTIEIISTDAEGRLILADAISYAKSFKPGAIIDFATLTGACVIALGKNVAGVMGNSQKLVNLLLAAGGKAGESVWQLPLDEAFSERVKGDIADYKNYSGRDGSTSTAAALLGKFAGDTPWVHVDIAGPFWNDSDAISCQPKGGTGFGVDLAIRALESFASSKQVRRSITG